MERFEELLSMLRASHREVVLGLRAELAREREDNVRLARELEGRSASGAAARLEVVRSEQARLRGVGRR